MKLLEKKIALITGASRGIGRCTALTLAENGADVLFTDLKDNDDSASLVKEIAAMGVRCKFYAVNASDFSAVQKMADEIKNEFGRLDILINNAGITRDNLILRMTPEDWDLVLTVNLKSVFNNVKAFMPMMMKQHSGSIINLSSIVGINGNAGQANYSASKAGIIGLTRSIAKEIGSRGIRCNAIAPGFIETPMTQQLPEDVRKDWMNQIPLRRGGEAKDIAKLALFLSSDLSDYITGQVIRCDGGLSI